MASETRNGMQDEILSVKGLRISSSRQEGQDLVKGISFQLARKQILGIVGESGSGKTLTALSLIRLLDQLPGLSREGSILFRPDPDKAFTDILDLDPLALRALRGKHLGFVFQEPMSALNPLLRCGFQVAERITQHLGLGREETKSRTLELFAKVRLPDPERVWQSYPHELSGGQLQRVMIAMAIACHPVLLIADEPTTALDVSVQRSLLQLLLELRESEGLSIIFISHDLGVISEIADQVLVMRDGEILETGPVLDVFQHPVHPYTQGLLACRPSLSVHQDRLPTVENFLSGKLPASLENQDKPAIVPEPEGKPLLELRHVSIRYPIHRDFWGRPDQYLDAVRDISFSVFRGESVGLLGESGSGKSTLAKAILRLTEVHSGEILLDGFPVQALSPSAFRPYRKKVQLVFQDPHGSLNPRMTVRQILREPLELYRITPNSAETEARIEILMAQVGLESRLKDRYPHQLSGGQKQRVGIARALAIEPELIICDESVSALDVSIQAQILNLFKGLKETLNVSYLFISHDVAVLRYICDRICVLHQGRIVESGRPDAIIQSPKEEYTRNLILSIPGKTFV